MMEILWVKKLMELEDFLCHLTLSVEGNNIASRNFSVQNDRLSYIHGHTETIANVGMSVEGFPDQVTGCEIVRVVDSYLHEYEMH
jgi:hypothetical protein